ncbi:MAG: hypothetical protein ACX94C_11805 [Phycisphaerales bacterium]
MKLTTQALIAGTVVLGAGVCMLIWGPERHDGVAVFLTIGGATMMGVKPVERAFNKNKENGP